ncbi:hypothetical protein J2X48_005259 [Bosea sp. BE271]|uniref:hypothetical protein n=1 Tax=Bosea TaxID=85413 RepID=UPI0027411E76|nr:MULTISPECIES: hypothetical protein [Bosea]MDR6831577.1 hypothetical protein [Bosea robiniae]MDR6898286.1 hypothetical protein [Bosea sp. BE109]MDR7141671.1 hypothetical protein [Bosea sp. BE168]MDR7178306.1 hypothetical protein [Bosea sp. BE271]
MSYNEPLSDRTIAISISESTDMAALGLAPEHLRDAAAEIARHLLALGARLAYGGDLRDDGFTELLFELVTRHRRDADAGDRRASIVNYLPWPSISSLSLADLKEKRARTEGLVEFKFLDLDGHVIPVDRLGDALARHSSAGIEQQLTAMRRLIVRETDALVALGGRVEGFKGKMPGVAEEVLSAIVAERPLYLMGGFGGCARDIAAEMRLLPGEGGGLRWKGRDNFGDHGLSALRNGLERDESHSLARTAHVDQAVALIVRGLVRCARG